MMNTKMRQNTADKFVIMQSSKRCVVPPERIELSTSSWFFSCRVLSKQLLFIHCSSSYGSFLAQVLRFVVFCRGRATIQSMDYTVYATEL
jgi:hypothetical protein